MRLVRVAFVVAGLVLGVAPAAARAADRSRTVAPGAPATWTGVSATGTNTTFNPQTGTPCSNTTAATRCDTTLLTVNVPASFWDTQGGGVEIRARNFTAPTNDFDLFVYKSDAAGTVGQLVAASAGAAGSDESVALQQPSGFFLVVVVYFDVNPAPGQYTGDAAFFFRNKLPADVDTPPGLPSSPASNPALGYRSHSEPHIAQSPTNPNLLIAASKMYNRDPGSLARYQFKIGTYVSFDGGQSWHDLGPLDVCPADQAPASSWPNNTCYPADDPNVTGDVGEKYITSDVWIQFDDEGNAYAMVLDSPPFANGNGWGMTLHRWDTPSQADIDSGQTWSQRIPIDKYDAPTSLLDDKNTFAVNNAGPDGDGQTGTMVACWSLDDTAANAAKPQQIACKRSTDGGRTWPGGPQGISGGDQAGIGAHVIAGTRDPNLFYVAWLTIGVPPAPSEIHVARSTDGGQTWSSPAVAAQLTNLPNTFPRQSFRNLSIPIGGVGPSGEIYISYADYRPAPLAGDEDGRQADIMVVKSTDGGTTWSTPAKVNSDATNADQFQPYLAVTPLGQVDVSFFDRRLDAPSAPAGVQPGSQPGTNSGNFFIDTWLARSNDGGATFTEVRVSHDSWDPSINPPISNSGQFIGDYQGMVADDCFAIPFVNDTHLANAAGRDPEFDAGLPRSTFQEVFSSRVPNTAEFGGSGRCGEGAQPAPAPAAPVAAPPAKGARSGVLLSLLTRRLRVSRAGTTRVRLRCASAQACRITLTVLARRGSRRTRLARRTFTLQAGTTRTVTLRLTPTGRRLLRRRPTGPGSLNARVTSAGRRATVRRAVTIVGPRSAPRLKVFGP